MGTRHIVSANWPKQKTRVGVDTLCSDSNSDLPEYFSSLNRWVQHSPTSTSHLLIIRLERDEESIGYSV